MQPTSVHRTRASFRLLERELELAALEEVLLLKTGVVALEAGIGLGKTALLHAACQRARALGYQVLRASGVELEQDFALGIVRQLFERRLASADSSELSQQISACHRPPADTCRAGWAIVFEWRIRAPPS